MKNYRQRILSIFIVLSLFVVSCGEKDPMQTAMQLKVTPSAVVFPKSASSQTVTVTTNAETWKAVVKQGDWFTLSADSGTSPGGEVVITAGECGSQSRTGQIEFSAPGCIKVTVNVSQEPVSEVIGPGKTGLFTVEDLPDADSGCTLYYRAAQGTVFYGYTQPLYAHIGIVETEWMYVQADWNTNIDKCRFQPMEEANLWKLELKPTIREYFNSGDTPVGRIGVVVRSSDGSKQTEDLFIKVNDSKNTFVPDPVINESAPAGVKHGINYNADGSVTLVLYDKDTRGQRHDWCYLIGDFNGFKRTKEYAMKRDDQQGVWWYTFTSAEKGKEYLFQYYLGKADDSKKVHDPYSEIVYDSSNDKYISSSTYPGLRSYPEGTSGLVGAFCVSPETYRWKNEGFRIKDKDNLVIYELHLRDFSSTSDLNGAYSKLDYLSDLGVGAIELMPVQEFDGNDSWGYNPCSYFALDKAYGSPARYKEFIDACHERGIAVIVDVVYNQATGAHPYAKMYWDASANKTASYNPFFNVDAPHPYSVFHDWNHENTIVRNHVKESLEYLLTEYKVDGFRFDLTKGFTNRKCDESNASNYDQSRIDILKDYNSAIKAVNPDAIVILEHFCETREENELAKDGMKVWRNLNYNFSEAAKGNASGSDLGGLWTGSAMPFGSLVGFSESHDEERTAYKSLSEGVSSVKNSLKARMQRESLCGAFLLCVPGPKMLWQFQELGYDVSIDEGGRTGRKPVHWEYLDDPDRKRLHDDYRTILKFRNDNPEFFDESASVSLKVGTSSWNNGKTISISASGKSFILVGNFNTSDSTIDVSFPSEGTWTNLQDPGESYTGSSASLSMEAAQWKIFINW
ncbi:MAG: alpha-amylase family glycosyl hydrolase [Bacteroidales bacterium]|nr:alpha-amylase family glycosyl hydrolase [Bacteroidales bacterium]